MLLFKEFQVLSIFVKNSTLEKFLCINNTNTDPYFNLATEEYLLKNKTDDIFMLWCNEPVVVVGKHQNAMAEINYEFIEKQKIKVARRLSGGGTVYHDAGNLNFTYIMNGETGKLVDFTRYTDDILEVLNNLGVPAARNKRNDLIINDKKISGNAEHIFKQRVIHHGTLLFNSDLEVLNEAIKVKTGEYSDKAVQSVRSKVTNIAPYLKTNLGIRDLRKELMDYMLQKYEHARIFQLSDDDITAIEKLKNEKYTTWDWIFGYSPKYVLKKEVLLEGKTMEVELTIKKGNILSALFSGELLNEVEINVLSQCLAGQRHDKQVLTDLMTQNADCHKIKSNLLKEFIHQLF